MYATAATHIRSCTTLQFTAFLDIQRHLRLSKEKKDELEQKFNSFYFEIFPKLANSEGTEAQDRRSGARLVSSGVALAHINTIALMKYRYSTEVMPKMSTTGDMRG